MQNQEELKELHKIHVLLLIGSLFLAILAGITLSSCKVKTEKEISNTVNQEVEIHEIEIIDLKKWINKSCYSDIIFVQSLVNANDTITIDDFSLSESFYTREQNFFTITLNKKIKELKGILIPRFTICKDNEKVECIAVVYGSSSTHPKCDYSFLLDSTNTVKFTNGFNQITCYWRDPNLFDF